MCKKYFQTEKTKRNDERQYNEGYYNSFRVKKSHWKPIRVSNFYSDSYIEYELNDAKNKTLSIKEYLDEIKPYLEKYDSWKIQLMIAINFSKGTDEERVMHSFKE